MAKVYSQAPVILTFLAPADQCNQHCPSCILTTVNHEPVTQFDLKPEDYARFVQQFVDAGIPILGVIFQGYEVTLPKSWPFVEAVFAVTNEHNIPKSFITNGMLLHKRTERIMALSPERISISIDGASPEVNDPIRGLDGAFETTISSIRKFLDKAPDYADRLGVASCLYSEENFRSLFHMPKILKELGIPRWLLSFAMTEKQGDVTHAENKDVLCLRFEALLKSAENEGIQCCVADEFNEFEGYRDRINAKKIYDLDFVYRMDPLGYVRNGHEIRNIWSEEIGCRWDPVNGNAPEDLMYWEKNKKFAA